MACWPSRSECDKQEDVDLSQTSNSRPRSRFFEKEPEAMKVFGFNGEENPSQTGLGRMGMLIHSMRMVQMFDTVMNLLGPDTDSLRDILQQLGKRHISYGVKANFFPHFGEALIESLAEVLADDWNDELERAWVEIYDQISGEIVHSILSQ